MYAYDGVGLAASQIGKNIQMIAVTEHKNNKRGEVLRAYVLVNPEIIERSPTTVL
jgi:peptide deformylase